MLTYFKLLSLELQIFEGDRPVRADVKRDEGDRGFARHRDEGQQDRQPQHLQRALQPALRVAETGSEHLPVRIVVQSQVKRLLSRISLQLFVDPHLFGSQR